MDPVVSNKRQKMSGVHAPSTAPPSSPPVPPDLEGTVAACGLAGRP